MAFDRQNEFSGLRPIDGTDINLAALEACMTGHDDARKAGA